MLIHQATAYINRLTASIALCMRRNVAQRMAAKMIRLR